MVKTGDDGSSFVVLGLKHFFNNMASVAYTGNLVPSGREDSDGVADAGEEDDVEKETAFDEFFLEPPLSFFFLRCSDALDVPATCNITDAGLLRLLFLLVRACFILVHVPPVVRSGLTIRLPIILPLIIPVMVMTG